jgi:signal transduction histidine kinase
LVAALEAHVRRIGLDVQIVADERLTAERFPQQVEAAVYFCSLEALRQVTSDGTSSGGEIQLRAAGGWLEFSVPLGHRSGGSTASDLDDRLEGMRDRVEALGGSLDLRATPEGRTVVGRVPAGEPDAADALEPVG